MLRNSLKLVLFSLVLISITLAFTACAGTVGTSGRTSPEAAKEYRLPVDEAERLAVEAASTKKDSVKGDYIAKYKGSSGRFDLVTVQRPVDSDAGSPNVEIDYEVFSDCIVSVGTPRYRTDTTELEMIMQQIAEKAYASNSGRAQTFFRKQFVVGKRHERKCFVDVSVFTGERENFMRTYNVCK